MFLEGLMKKILQISLAITILLCAFAGCKQKIEPPIIELTPEELEALTNPNFSSEAFAEGDCFHQYIEEDWNELFSKVPSDRYEIYPNLHNVPRTATLYKNGEVTFIDANDSRLIGLMNLYNNSVYYDEYAYLQGLFDLEDIKKIEAEEFRLVLTYTPYESSHEYAAAGTRYDTIIVTNDGFYLFDRDSQSYQEGAFVATSNTPFLRKYPWLDLFGF